MKNILFTVSIMLKTIISKYITNIFVQAIASSWLIVLGAHIIVPFYPVPMTLQTFVVAIIGLLMPWKIALASVGLYVSYAAIGMPVLQGGVGGMGVLLGPTAGYIAGFFFMSTIISLMMQYFPKSGIIKRLSFVLLGTGVVFFLGVAHLASLLNLNWNMAIKMGFYPFIFSELIKCIVATYVSVCIQDRCNKQNS